MSEWVWLARVRCVNCELRWKNRSWPIWVVSHSDRTIKVWWKVGVKLKSEVKWPSLKAANGTESVKKVCFFSRLRFTQIFNSRKKISISFSTLSLLLVWVEQWLERKERQKKCWIHAEIESFTLLHKLESSTKTQQTRHTSQWKHSEFVRPNSRSIADRKRRVGRRRRKGEEKNVENIDEIGGNRIIFYIKHSTKFRFYVILEGESSSTVNWLELISTIDSSLHNCSSLHWHSECLSLTMEWTKVVCLSRRWANVKTFQRTRKPTTNTRIQSETCRKSPHAADDCTTTKKIFFRSRTHFSRFFWKLPLMF